MPILKDVSLTIEIDQVLAAQGLNPSLVRTKRPKLVELTRKAIEVGSPLLEPRAIIEQYPVSRVVHNRIDLTDGHYLQGELIGNQISSASSIAVAVCTIGEKIDEFVSATFSHNPALAMAVEGLASAATEILGNHVCSYVESHMLIDGMKMSNPLNPGMIGWPVEEGQPQIFALVNASHIGVQLEASGLMKPLKSLSLVIGLGTKLEQKIQQCDLCTLKKTCTQRLARIN